MTIYRRHGFSEEAAEYTAGKTATATHLQPTDFVQAERVRLRAGEIDTPPVVSSADVRLAGLADRPSPESDEVTVRRLSRFKELWNTRHQGALASLPRGTNVIVDMATGLYVTGDNFAAWDRFEALFGGTRQALSQEVGVPITLGGGLWALQSEE
jgi:hypothetical protein